MVTLHRVHQIEHMLFDPCCSCLFARMYHHHWSTCQREAPDHPVSDRSFLQQPWEFPFDQMFTEVPSIKKPKVAHQEHSKQYACLLSFFFLHIQGLSEL